MIENCTLYFPAARLPLEEVFPDGTSDGGPQQAATWFEYESGDGRVRLNLEQDDLASHLQGFRSYVAQLPNSGEARANAQKLISATQSVAGVILPEPVAPDSRVFGSLMHLINVFGGFMFVADSILLPDGSFVVGPMAGQDAAAGEAAEPEIFEVDPNDYRHQAETDGVDPQRVAMRERHYYQLAQRGFRCARWLPLYRHDDQQDHLRPGEEIAGRLLALNALFLYVSAPPEVAATDRLRAFFDRARLSEHLTDKEDEIRQLPRDQAHAQHTDSIGWRLENMWALAWMLGFDPVPPFYQGQLPDEVTRAIVLEFAMELDGTIASFLSRVAPRPVREVAELEDLYYCAHHAVRSAQTGEDAVPSYFHPVRDGGAIHERRQA